MGNFWGKRHHNHQLLHQPSPSSPNQPTPPQPQSTLPPLPPPLPQPVIQPLPHPTTLELPYYPSPQPPVQYPQPPQYQPTSQPPPFPPPLLPHNYGYNSNHNYNYSNCYYRPPLQPAGQYSGYGHYYYVNTAPQFSGFGPGPSVAPVPPINPAPYIDHKTAKRIVNDFNVKKDTIRLQLDDQNPDCHVLSFTFDATVDGNITVLYFAKDERHCTISPMYPEIRPVKIPFQKGAGQKFYQPSGTGLDLGFFDTEDLSKPAPGGDEGDVYPLVISVESLEPSAITDTHSNGKPVNMSPSAQKTLAVLEKNDDGIFHVKVIKQILWVDGERYEMREIFGISSSDKTAISDLDSGKECVICLSEAKNTVVLPCRHMCMCSECAKELNLQSDKCPICRQPIEKLIEINVGEEAAV